MMQSVRWDRRACPFQSGDQLPMKEGCAYCATPDQPPAPSLRHLVELLREAATAVESALSVGVLAPDEATGPAQPRPGGPASEGWPSLTVAELAIADLIGDALTNRQIARRVFRSPHTVNYHLRQIYRKLGINSRVQLAALVQSRRQAGPARPAA